MHVPFMLRIMNLEWTSKAIKITSIFLCLFTGNDPANEETPNSLRLILRGSPGP